MSSFLTGTAGSGAGQYLTDQYGQPWMFRGDFCWSLVTNAGQGGAGGGTWQQDMTTYLSTRAGQGFNLVYVAAVSNIEAGATSNNGQTFDGIVPFVGGVVGGSATMTTAYWARVSYLVSTAATYGITVMINAAMTESLQPGCVFDGATNAQFTSYGTGLAGLFASSPNVAWSLGDDYFGTADAQYSALLAALRAGGDTHLISIEDWEEGDSRYYAYNGSSFAWGLANAQWDWVYTYNASYVQVEYGYTQPGAGGNGPVVLSDGYWDGGAYGGTDFMRILAWWALSSGSRGQVYGSVFTAYTPAGFIASLTSGSDSSALQQDYWNIFTTLPGWNRLVPDTSSVLVTAGRGTHLGYIQYTSPQYGGTPNTYVTASITPDGKLAVIYNPAADTQTITVYGALMQAGYSATWVDPASGAKTPATIGSTYTRSAANSVGEHDWLLVLQGPATVPVPLPASPLNRPVTVPFFAGRR